MIFPFLAHFGPPLENLETTIDDNITEEGGGGAIGIDVSDSDIGTIGLANTCTDKYLRTLQKIAKQNAETGQFKTSLPKDQVLVIGQNISSSHSESKSQKNPIVENAFSLQYFHFIFSPLCFITE